MRSLLAMTLLRALLLASLSLHAALAAAAQPPAAVLRGQICGASGASAPLIPGQAPEQGCAHCLSCCLIPALPAASAPPPRPTLTLLHAAPPAEGPRRPRSAARSPCARDPPASI
ncbi:hypothetical protein [Oceanicella actignis]|uniref:hypothetical protein n=1 Tax=Oceanicella actignis TaxID=1189325 RepID=UPI0011E69A47|nr:hypothetical protein [Oceanicella actignis]